MAMPLMQNGEACDCCDFGLEEGVSKDDAPAPRPSESVMAQLREWVRVAALEVKARVAQHCGGSLPCSTDGWMQCCEAYGIRVCGLKRGSIFTAVLVGARGGPWWIFYNSAASSLRQARSIAHELAEYITREESWHIQPPPGCRGLDEHHVRHLIAREFERIACEHP